MCRAKCGGQVVEGKVRRAWCEGSTCGSETDLAKAMVRPVGRRGWGGRGCMRRREWGRGGRALVVKGRSETTRLAESRVRA